MQASFPFGKGALGLVALSTRPQNDQQLLEFKEKTSVVTIAPVD